MAKAASPIRLQQDLMQAAELAGKRFHRSTAEQIEYWAALGQSVSSTLDPDVVLSIKAGLTRLNVEPVVSPGVDPDEVFGTLESQRKSGVLSRNVTGARIRYQSSSAHPGWLERVDQNGDITVGQFKNGEFIALEETRL